MDRSRLGVAAGVGHFRTGLAQQSPLATFVNTVPPDVTLPDANASLRGVVNSMTSSQEEGSHMKARVVTYTLNPDARDDQICEITAAT